MKMKSLSIFLVAVILFSQIMLCLPVNAAAPNITYQPYSWGNVAIGGGGYITGLVIHPRIPNLVYARTDVGGVYRWDEAGQMWKIITDNSVINCADGIAVDEKNPDNVYLYAGNNESYQGIYKSTDRGNTWSKCYSVTANANALHRWKGEPIVVDPNNSNIIYCGTRDNGLFKSTDAGATWTTISTSVIPKGEATNGIRVVAYDRFGAVAGGVTQKLYVSVSGDGIYRTKDGGATWEAIGGEKDVSRMVVDRNGSLIVGGSTGLYKYNGSSWVNISPEQGKGIAGVDVDISNPNRLIAVRNQKFPDDVFKLPIFRSEDGGNTWFNVSTSMTKQPDVPWWPDSYFSAATSCVLFDPLNSSKVYLSDWYGVWMTSNFWAPTVNWYTHEKGHEETVVLGLSCPPKGAPLFSGLADVNGFRHTDIVVYPQSRSTGNQECTSIDYCETNPNYMIRTEDNGHGATGTLSTSSDNGISWKTVTNWTYGLAIRSAYSSTDTNAMVVLTSEGTPKRSIDGGATWQNSIGAPATTISGIWSKQPQPLAADKVNGSKFYYYTVQSGVGKLFVSTDKGLNWSVKAQSLPSTGGALRARPGVEGELLLATGSGLYRSTDSGATFTQLSGVTAVKALSYGKAEPGSLTPAIYINGTVNGLAGLFRSDDNGANWVKINTDGCKKMLDCIRIEADRQTYGRIYGATGGRGIYYGDISGTISTTPPAPPITPTPAASGTSNLIFADDFENYVQGAAPNVWDVSLDSDATCIIESVGEATYRKYLSVSDGSTASKVIISKGFQDVDKEFTAKWEYNTENTNDLTTFIFSNGTGESIKFSAASLAMSANVWHEIKVECNVTNQRYNVFLDNTCIMSGNAFLQAVPSINKFSVVTPDTAAVTFKLDNFSINGSLIENAAMPVASPGPGFHSNIANVTLSCSTQDATIYYTTDGSEPTASSKIFTTASSLVVDKNTTIKAKAVAPGHKDSETAVYRFYYGTKLFEDQFMNETAGAAPSQWTTAVNAFIEPNLLLNPGFENGTVNGVLAGWEKASQTGTPKVGQVTPGHNGSSAGEGKAGDSNSAYTYSLDQVINGIPNGTAYKYSGWFRYTGTAFDDKSSFSANYGSYTKAVGFGAPGSEPGKVISPIKVTYPITTEWQKFEMSGVSVTANAIRLKIWMNNPAGMNLQFDDLEFTGGNKNYAKLLNGDSLLSKQFDPLGSIHTEFNYSFDKDMPVEFSFNHSGEKVVRLYSDGTQLGYYDSNSIFVKVMDVIPSKWYNIKMGMDKSNSGKYYLYVDGILKGENFSFGGTQAPITSFAIATPSTSILGSVLINNVSIYGTLANPEVMPVAFGFDKNPAIQANFTADIVWNGASQITGIKNGNELLNPEDYSVTGSALTINKNYLAAQPVGDLKLTVMFDKGTPAVLNIKIIDTTPVEMPVASLAGGEVAFGTSVGLTCSTNGAAIYYTTDGSSPTKSSTLYTRPILIDSNITIKAIAVKDGMTNSEEMSESYIQASTSDMTNIQLSEGISNYSFSGGIYTYSGVVAEKKAETIIVTPIGAGVITVDGIQVESGQPSAPISLDKGVEKTITVMCTEPGKISKTYIIKVTRKASNGNAWGKYKDEADEQ